MTEITQPATEIDGAAIEDPATGLAAVVALRRLADRLEDAQVERAMRAGCSWSQVAEALGVTRQAVHKKHARRLIAAGVQLRRRND
jgi:ATP-dependent Clp protease ATP-binding subunit ClpA